MTPTDAPTRYESLEELDAYRRSVERCLDGVSVAAGSVVIDIGAGAGSVASCLLGSGAEPARLVCVEPDGDMCQHLIHRFGEAIQVFQGTHAEYLNSAEIEADVVVFANCIHLIDDLNDVVSMCRRVLRPRGHVALTTAFWGDTPTSEELALRLRLVQAIRSLASPDERRVRASRNVTERTESDIAAAFAAGGFEREMSRVDVGRVPREYVKTIYTSPMFATGAVPWATGQAAAQIVARALLILEGRTQLTGFERRWLTMRFRLADDAIGER